MPSSDAANWDRRIRERAAMVALESDAAAMQTRIAELEAELERVRARARALDARVGRFAAERDELTAAAVASSALVAELRAELAVWRTAADRSVAEQARERLGIRANRLLKSRRPAPEHLPEPEPSVAVEADGGPSDEQLVRESGLFDELHYRRGAGLLDGSIDALTHFLAAPPEAVASPHPLFDLAMERPDEAGGGNPLVAFLRGDGLTSPHPLFDAGYYLRRSPDVAAAAINPLVHYVNHGGREGRAPCAWFDSAYYLSANPDVAAAAENPLVHYLARGADEGRDPSAEFSTSEYRSDNADVLSTGLNPLVHYVLWGRAEGRPPKRVVAQVARPATFFDGLLPPDQADERELPGAGAAARFGFVLGDDLDAATATRAADQMAALRARGLVAFSVPAGAVAEQSTPLAFCDVIVLVAVPMEEQVERLLACVRRAGGLVCVGLDEDRELDGAAVERLLARRAERAAGRADLQTVTLCLSAISRGSGGHGLFFALARDLCRRGLSVHVVVAGTSADFPDSGSIAQTFDLARPGIAVSIAPRPFARTQVAVASFWQTAEPIAAAREHIDAGVYLVQDYEPMFYPTSAEWFAASRSYHRGLEIICRGHWLAGQLAREEGLHDLRSVPFDIDRAIYHPGEEAEREADHIAFLARASMPRRLYGLGLEALRIVARDRPSLRVTLVGSPEIPARSLPEAWLNAGVVTADELAELYRHATIGIAFSPTNPSLVPYQMMACGLPVVDVALPDTALRYGSAANVFAADPTPEDVAAVVAMALDRPDRRRQVAAGASAFTAALTDHQQVLDECFAHIREIYELSRAQRSTGAGDAG